LEDFKIGERARPLIRTADPVRLGMKTSVPAADDAYLNPRRPDSEFVSRQTSLDDCNGICDAKCLEQAPDAEDVDV
jgi:hypothetical protein